MRVWKKGYKLGCLNQAGEIYCWRTGIIFKSNGVMDKSLYGLEYGYMVYKTRDDAERKRKAYEQNGIKIFDCLYSEVNRIKPTYTKNGVTAILAKKLYLTKYFWENPTKKDFRWNIIRLGN